MSIKEKVRVIFIKSFNLELMNNIEDIEYESIGQWNSVGHMTLIASLENEFDIMFETDDIIDMNSYKKVVATVEKYLSKP